MPFIAGSTPDSLARIVAESLQQRLAQPFVVENRPGASGNTGTAAVAKAAPDGHTLGVSIVGPLVINHLLFAKMPYETAKDIAPITILASQPSVLTLAPNVAADSVESLLAAIKREPDKFTYGSIGRGSLSHLAMASLAMKAGVTVVHLPFAGSPAAVTALLRGDVQMAVLPAASVAPQAGPGKLKLLAVTSPQRSALLPESADVAGGGHRRRRGRRLGRPHRPRRHERRGPRQDSQGGRRRSGRARAGREAQGPVHGADRQFSRRVPRRAEAGARPLGPDHRRRRHQGRVGAARARKAC